MLKIFLAMLVDGDLPVFFSTATQAQRDHEIFQTRNFRVQPQAIMGSGIVE